MSFFERNRKNLAARGIDPNRLPPGQYSTDRFPVLHEGDIADYGDLSTWTLHVTGAVDQPLRFGWNELLALGTIDVVADIHCVTKWSKFDTSWSGVALDTILDTAGIDPAATHLIEHAEHGYTTNVPLDRVRGLDHRGQPRAVLATAYGGRPLEPEHGYPLRLVVPELYFWKSAKWLRRLELRVGDQPGFWETRGYHNDADPFLEQRYS